MPPTSIASDLPIRVVSRHLTYVLVTMYVYLASVCLVRIRIFYLTIFLHVVVRHCTACTVDMMVYSFAKSYRSYCSQA